ncbi:MAG: 16S rRNA (cytosine(967)-C(5))-methyltransferase RsmB [Methylovulum sp.]|uniref:16S rRNA (cytosine(967)-C(5))-methyltransferase RsmB n=1 Tax=Methylovulum sp. TaxID=1916980 RepID=UPI00262B9315|nr:16S rRNA (cytosine(967)-C(5))-methyltransferase RsmB [Methylovulum sp.]MDD2724087.1 16S rRNA (cytosine(967)-C(5))-methyltransferase RsmB [Methylovulum sp.]MDD5125976.1 16S rRNA (cytosine(967)-C(5))-methyltransferase RsmB [Methylovulum sp.]
MSANTRAIAARVLADVIENGHSLTAILDNTLSSIPSNKDRAFIQMLCYGVCRHYHHLDFILGKLVAKPLKDMDIKALVLVGLYQLQFMRVKPHAAVSETVLAVGKKNWAKGLVNALLRTYLREQTTLEAQARQVATAAWSHPDWLIRLIQQDWPEQAEQIFIANNLQAPMALRINLAKIDTQAYLQQLNAKDITASSVDFCPSALVLGNAIAVDELPGFASGWVSVQDTAAQLAAELLDLRPGQRVLDVCAAPGGKTAHILEAQAQLQIVMAVDIDASRLQRVGENLQRLGLSAKLICGDAADPQNWWDGQVFERILLDAPCSATGVIRRHPDIKLLRRAEDIAQLQALQETILNAIWPLLAKDGILLYATCSVLKQENEYQIRAFLAGHADAEELPCPDEWGAAASAGRQILPGESGMDGFYYARLRKL